MKAFNCFWRRRNVDDPRCSTVPMMMSWHQKSLLVATFYLVCLGIAAAQEVVVEVTYDTVYAGNMVGVRYSMENWQGDMVEPDFGDFAVVGGPQISSSMSISGGQRNSSKIVTMFLRPPEEPGNYVIPALTFKGENKELLTDEKKITVMDNPEGIRQNPTFEHNPPQNFNRQYRRSEPPQGKRQRF